MGFDNKQAKKGRAYPMLTPVAVCSELERDLQI